MTRTTTKRKTSLLALALGSLVATSLSTGTAEAAPSLRSARCATQCTQVIVGKSDAVLKNCVKNCPDSVKKILESLKAKHKLKDQEMSFNNGKLEDKATKEKEKRTIENKIKQLKKENEHLAGDIKKIENALHTTAPQDPATQPDSQPTAKEMGNHPSTSPAEGTTPKAPFVSRRDPTSPRAPLPPASKQETGATNLPPANSKPTPAPLPSPSAADLPPPLVNSAGKTPPPRPYRAPRSGAEHNSGSNVPPPVPSLPPAPPLPPEHS